MTTTEHILLIGAVAAATILTRFLPFLLFPAGRGTPSYIRYLGGVLPAAVFGLLVVYSVRGVDFCSGTHGLPELIGIAATAALHCLKRQMLLSIAGGTALYMVLVQTVFS